MGLVRESGQFPRIPVKKYKVNRAESSLGEFTLEEISEKLIEGELKADDLGWTEGMGEWLPLWKIEGVNASDPEEFDFEKLKAGDEEEWAKAQEVLFPIAVAAAGRQLLKFLGSKQISLQQDAETVAAEAISGKWRKTKKHFSGGLRQNVENGRIQSNETLRAAASNQAKNLAQELGKSPAMLQGLDITKPGWEKDIDYGSIVKRTKTPLEEIIDKETKELLAMCMEMKLNEKEYNVTTGFFFEGLKYREISEKHGIRMGSIGGSLQDAYKKLRECLEQHGVDWP